jgi:hypothetical protein
MGNEQRPNGPTIVSTDFFIKTNPGNETLKNRLAKKVLVYVPQSLALLLAMTACGAQISTTNPTETTITDPPAITELLLGQTATPEIATTPTVEINRNHPSPFADLYFGSYTENGQTKIVRAIDGNMFENQNPGCTIKTVAAAHESQLNTLYSLTNPEQPAGYMVYENYLNGIFDASADKSGETKGFYNGIEVKLIDNVWQMQKDGRTLFLNPVVPNVAGHYFSFPVICEKNGQLMMGLIDKDGAIVDNTLQSAFQSAEQIAKDYGYIGTGKAASVGIMKDGRLEVKDTNGNTLAYLQFLGKGETKIFPSLPEGVSTMTVYNYETGKDETLSPTFDEEMDTYVWKNQKGEIRRFLDKETGHIFAQTESARDNLIYQIDTEFGWEADLTQFAKKNKKYSPAALSYLYMLQNSYPDVITVFGENTKLTFKIVHGSYDDVVDKSKISSIKDREEPNLQMSFFWPIYNARYDGYLFATYLNYDHIKVNDAIRGYTQDMLNGCLTSNFSSSSLPIGVLDLPIPKKIIK